MDPTGVMVFQLCNCRNGQYSKRDAFLLLDAEERRDNLQFMASVVLIRRTPFAQRFRDRWLAISQDARAITDADNTLGRPNFPEFRDHRHDQSMLSRWRTSTC